MANASSDQCTRGPSFEKEITASLRLTHATVACLKVHPYRPCGWKSFGVKMSADLDLRARQSSPTELSTRLWEYPLALVPRQQISAEEGGSATTEDLVSGASSQEGTECTA